MASNAQKLSAATEFINDAPPGEMVDVLAGTLPSRDDYNRGDIRTILEKNSNEEFTSALEQYNTEQLITFKTAESGQRVVPC
jgi:F-actin capping protein alpha subunit